MGDRYRSLRRAAQAVRWGLYGLLAGITLAQTARVVLGEWLDEPPNLLPDDTPDGPPPGRTST